MGCCGSINTNKVIRDENVAVKCKVVPISGQPIFLYFKSNLTFKEIKTEIAKKIKKDKRSFYIEVKGTQTKYENMQLSYFVTNKFEEIEMKVLDNNTANTSNSKAHADSNYNSKNLTKENKEKDLEKDIKEKDLLNKFNSKNSNNSISNNQLSGIDNVLDEQAVILMSKTCDIHGSHNVGTEENDKQKNFEDTKLTMICQTCGQGICALCANELHKDHTIIKKIDIIEFNKTLTEYQETLTDQIQTMKLDIDHTEIIKNYKMETKKFSEMYNKMIEEINKKESELIEAFKLRVDSNLPFIINYRDNLLRLNIEYDRNLNNIISDDKVFMQYYLDYLILSNQVVKSAENINSMKNNLTKFNWILEDYQKRTSLILDVVKENYTKINKYLTEEFDRNLSQMTAIVNQNESQADATRSPKTNKKGKGGSLSPSQVKALTPVNSTIINPKNRISLKNLIDFQSKNISNNSQIINNANNTVGDSVSQNFVTNKRINLKSLMETPNKIISNLIKKQKKKKILIDPNFNNEGHVNLDIINEFDIVGQEINPTCIYTIEENSENVFIFKCQESIVIRQPCKLSGSGISKFQSHHSILNYRCHFYLSGGLGSSRSLMGLDTEDDYTMKPLPNMLSNHSFHCMLGVLNSIWIISGTNTTKVEKYSMDNKEWTALPSLNTSRTWPSSVYVEKLGVFVFGGYVDTSKMNEENNTNETSESYTLKIEKLDIKIIMQYYNNDSPIEQETTSSWEVINLSFDKDYVPIYSGFIYLPNENIEIQSHGNILILGGKTNIEDYESEEKVLNISLDTFLVKEEAFTLDVADEFDGRLFIKYNIKVKNEDEEEIDKTCYAQFSSCVSKRVHIFIDNKMEIQECDIVTAQSSFIN